ncbi:MAG: hypothetical protein EU548_07480 [Promethearchaeota archaeon]|nr:MAG: hypothetical protein EU548_07480 [Candidatus Lokiarchaeota archaeon]
MSQTRKFLMKKLLTICPVCKKRIFGKDIDIQKIDKNKIVHWPLKYVHCHQHQGVPFHALTMYLDSNFAVRGRDVSDFLKIQD